MSAGRTLVTPKTLTDYPQNIANIDSDLPASILNAKASSAGLSSRRSVGGNMPLSGTFLSGLYVDIVDKARVLLGASSGPLPEVPAKERLSAEEVHQIWAALDDIDSEKTLGSEIGITLLPSAPLIEYMRHAASAHDTVLDALMSFSRLWALMASTNELELFAPSHVNERFKVCPVYGPGRRSRIASQVTLGAVLCGMRAISTRPVSVVETHLSSPLSSGARARIAEIFGGKVYDRAERDALFFAPEVASYPSREPDRALVSRVSNKADALLKKLEVESELESEVLKLVQRLAPTPTLNEVAKAMGLSERTLQRRLKEKGLTFRSLACRGRLHLAKYFLRCGCSITEAAFLAGYSDISAFTRAYKTFYGCPPSHDHKKRTTRQLTK